jgi:hypothetical protein
VLGVHSELQRDVGCAKAVDECWEYTLNFMVLRGDVGCAKAVDEC